MNSRSLKWKIIRIALFPFAVLHGCIVYIRNFLFDKGILKPSSFNFPVICIGNLSVGGTGKSPMTEYLIEVLHKKYVTATVSRGYKRKTRGYVLANEKTTALDIGDEPMQFFQKYPDVSIAVGEERAIAIPLLLFDKPKTEVIILDDAFQHRSVKAGFNILLTDYNNPFYKDYMLPTGSLRDTRSGYKRADVIVVTKCDENKITSEKESIEKRIVLKRNQHLFFTTLQYKKPYHLLDKTEITLHKNTSVLVACGIANPTPLMKYLNTKVAKTDSLFFRDHHIFNIDDLKTIKETFQRLKGEKKIIIVTEKDAVRLVKFDAALKGLPIYVLPISHHFLFNQSSAFNELIIAYIEKYNAKKSTYEETTQQEEKV